MAAISACSLSDVASGRSVTVPWSFDSTALAGAGLAQFHSLQCHPQPTVDVTRRPASEAWQYEGAAAVLAAMRDKAVCPPWTPAAAAPAAARRPTLEGRRPVAASEAGAAAAVAAATAGVPLISRSAEHCARRARRRGCACCVRVVRPRRHGSRAFRQMLISRFPRLGKVLDGDRG